MKYFDIGPLLTDETDPLSLDARVSLAKQPPKFKGTGHTHLAMLPYPNEYERRIVLGNNLKIFIRPVRPDDEALVRNYFQKVSQDDLRLRFFATVREFSHEFIARLTQLDHARANAFVAIDEDTGEMIGGVRLHADANHEVGEFAVLLRSDLKGRGLGWKLMEIILDYAKSQGLKRVEGQILKENTTMIKMCGELGFHIEDDSRDPSICIARLSLR